MLKVGLVGSVRSMEGSLRVLKNFNDIRVVGKSSVGMLEQPEGKYLSIPEYNRQELIEVADALIVDRTNLLFPDLLKTALKSRKHIYITDFPNFQAEECFQILKLAEEARTAVWIENPLRYEPFTGWIGGHWREPAYISLFEARSRLPELNDFLIRYLFYAYSLFRTKPQKIRTNGFSQQEEDFFFVNLRLDYPDYSVFNLELLVQGRVLRKVKAAMPGIFVEGDCLTGKGTLNRENFNETQLHGNSLYDFFSGYNENTIYSKSNLSDYYATIQTLEEVIRKIELYTPWSLH